MIRNQRRAILLNIFSVVTIVSVFGILFYWISQLHVSLDEALQEENKSHEQARQNQFGIPVAPALRMPSDESHENEPGQELHNHTPKLQSDEIRKNIRKRSAYNKSQSLGLTIGNSPRFRRNGRPNDSHSIDQIIRVQRQVNQPSKDPLRNRGKVRRNRSVDLKRVGDMFEWRISVNVSKGNKNSRAEENKTVGNVELSEEPAGGYINAATRVEGRGDKSEFQNVWNTIEKFLDALMGRKTGKDAFITFSEQHPLLSAQNETSFNMSSLVNPETSTIQKLLMTADSGMLRSTNTNHNVSFEKNNRTRSGKFIGIMNWFGAGRSSTTESPTAVQTDAPIVTGEHTVSEIDAMDLNPELPQSNGTEFVTAHAAQIEQFEGLVLDDAVTNATAERIHGFRTESEQDTNKNSTSELDNSNEKNETLLPFECPEEGCGLSGVSQNERSNHTQSNEEFWSEYDENETISDENLVQRTQDKISSDTAAEIENKLRDDWLMIYCFNKYLTHKEIHGVSSDFQDIENGMRMSSNGTFARKLPLMLTDEENVEVDDDLPMIHFLNSLLNGSKNDSFPKELDAKSQPISDELDENVTVVSETNTQTDSNPPRGARFLRNFGNIFNVFGSGNSARSVGDSAEETIVFDDGLHNENQIDPDESDPVGEPDCAEFFHNVLLNQNDITKPNLGDIIAQGNIFSIQKNFQSSFTTSYPQTSSDNNPEVEHKPTDFSMLRQLNADTITLPSKYVENSSSIRAKLDLYEESAVTTASTTEIFPRPIHGVSVEGSDGGTKSGELYQYQTTKNLMFPADVFEVGSGEVRDLFNYISTEANFPDELSNTLLQSKENFDISELGSGEGLQNFLNHGNESINNEIFENLNLSNTKLHSESETESYIFYPKSVSPQSRTEMASAKISLTEVLQSNAAFVNNQPYEPNNFELTESIQKVELQDSTMATEYLDNSPFFENIFPFESGDGRLSDNTEEGHLDPTFMEEEFELASGEGESLVIKEFTTKGHETKANDESNEYLEEEIFRIDPFAEGSAEGFANTETFHAKAFSSTEEPRFFLGPQFGTGEIVFVTEEERITVTSAPSHSKLPSGVLPEMTEPHQSIFSTVSEESSIEISRKLAKTVTSTLEKESLETSSNGHFQNGSSAKLNKNNTDVFEGATTLLKPLAYGTVASTPTIDFSTDEHSLRKVEGSDETSASTIASQMFLTEENYGVVTENIEAASSKMTSVNDSPDIPSTYPFSNALTAKDTSTIQTPVRSRGSRKNDDFDMKCNDTFCEIIKPVGTHEDLLKGSQSPEAVRNISSTPASDCDDCLEWQTPLDSEQVTSECDDCKFWDDSVNTTTVADCNDCHEWEMAVTTEIITGCIDCQNESRTQVVETNTTECNDCLDWEVPEQTTKKCLDCGVSEKNASNNCDNCDNLPTVDSVRVDCDGKCINYSTISNEEENAYLFTSTESSLPRYCSHDRHCDVLRNEKCVDHGLSSKCGCGKAFIRHPVTGICTSKIELVATSRFPKELYSDAYENPNSNEYQEIKSSAEKMMWMLIENNLDLSSSVAEFEAVEFRPGSLIVSWKIVLAINGNLSLSEEVEHVLYELEDTLHDEQLLAKFPLKAEDAVFLSISQAINPCTKAELNYCSRHADCMQDDHRPGGFLCKCQKGFKDFSKHKKKYPGEVCQPFCPSDYCGKHGTCQINSDSSISCTCDGWYYGEQCEVSGVLVVAGSAIGNASLVILAAACIYWMKKRRQTSNFQNPNRNSRRTREYGLNLYDMNPARISDILAIEDQYNIQIQPKFAANSFTPMMPSHQTDLAPIPNINIIPPSLSDCTFTYDSSFDSSVHLSPEIKRERQNKF